MVVSVAKNLDEYLEQAKKEITQKEKVKKFLKRLRLKQNILLLFVLYNILFIPIQFAFKIPFEGVFLGFECATIVVYTFDMTFRIVKLRRLMNLHKIPDKDLRLKDRRLKRDSELLKLAKRNLRIEILLTMLSVFPFNLLFQKTVWIKPRGVTAALCTLRMLNVIPIRKMFLKLSQYNLNLIRIIEVICYYYIIANWYACLGL